MQIITIIIHDAGNRTSYAQSKKILIYLTKLMYNVILDLWGDNTMGNVICLCGRKISDADLLRRRISTLISNFDLEEVSYSHDPYIAAEAKGKTVYHCDCGNIGITNSTSVIWYKSLQSG